jgi:Tautomerase enzyme
MVDTINVSSKDNFQVITEHDDQSLIYDPSYLDVPRTDSFIIVQITLNEGRALELEKLFYKTLAERLHGELGVRLENVFINLVEVKKENWSFGNVIPQYT